MKSLNSTDELWTGQPAADDMSGYQAACCLNARVNAPAASRSNPQILIENQHVSLDFLKKVVSRVEHAHAQEKGHAEDIKVAAPH